MFCFNQFAIKSLFCELYIDSNRIISNEKADSCQWDRASTLNDKLQRPLPRFPPNALVVHISIGLKRTLDDNQKGNRYPYLGTISFESRYPMKIEISIPRWRFDVPVEDTKEMGISQSHKNENTSLVPSRANPTRIIFNMHSKNRNWWILFNKIS